MPVDARTIREGSILNFANGGSGIARDVRPTDSFGYAVKLKLQGFEHDLLYMANGKYLNSEHTTPMDITDIYNP